MSAIDAAVERGFEAQTKKPKWEPVGVDMPGWLTARVRNLQTGDVEGVFFGQGAWQFTKLGRDKDDKVKSFDVREKELRKIAKAMIGPEAPDRDELITECARIRRAMCEPGEKKPAKRARRGKT